MKRLLYRSFVYEYSRIITTIYQGIDIKNYNDSKDYNQKLNKRFKLDQNKFEHGIIESCRFLLEDTECAIENFKDYGISGRTKKSDVGESYIRLYGLLNAIYLQISVPLKLIEVFKLEQQINKTKLKDEFKALPIYQTRNKISAHTIDYKGIHTYYRISQMTLSDKEISILNKDSIEKINLELEINNYSLFFNKTMFEVLTLITDKLFNPESKKYQEISALLESTFRKGKEGFFFEPYNEDLEIEKLQHQIDDLKSNIKTLESIKKAKNESDTNITTPS